MKTQTEVTVICTTVTEDEDLEEPLVIQNVFQFSYDGDDLKEDIEMLDGVHMHSVDIYS